MRLINGGAYKTTYYSHIRFTCAYCTVSGGSIHAKCATSASADHIDCKYSAEDSCRISVFLAGKFLKKIF